MIARKTMKKLVFYLTGWGILVGFLCGCQPDSHHLNPTSTLPVTSITTQPTESLTNPFWLSELLEAADSMRVTDVFLSDTPGYLPIELNGITVSWSIEPTEYVVLHDQTEWILDRPMVRFDWLNPAKNTQDTILTITGLFRKGTHSYLRHYLVTLSHQDDVTRYESIASMYLHVREEEIIQVQGYVVDHYDRGYIIQDATGCHLLVEEMTDTLQINSKIGDHVLLQGTYMTFGGGGLILQEQALVLSEGNSVAEMVNTLADPRTLMEMDELGIQGAPMVLIVTPRQDGLEGESSLDLYYEGELVARVSQDSPADAQEQLERHLDQEIAIEIRYYGLVDDRVEVLFCGGESKITPILPSVDSRLETDWLFLESFLDSSYYLGMDIVLPSEGPGGSAIEITSTITGITIEKMPSQVRISFPDTEREGILDINLTNQDKMIHQVWHFEVVAYELTPIARILDTNPETKLPIGTEVFVQGMVSRWAEDGFYLMEDNEECFIQNHHLNIALDDIVILRGTIDEVSAFEWTIRYLSGEIVLLKKKE